MTDQPSIVAALAAVMDDVRAVRKGDRNSQQNYAFRGIDAVMNAVGPALRKRGVVVVPILEEVNYRDVQTSTGKASRECTVKVRYRFHGPAGDTLDCVTPGESMDFGDKGAAKAMSVAYRIALLQALCLPTDDSDPDGSVYERGHTPQQRQAPKAAQVKTSGQTPAQRAKAAVDAILSAADEPTAATVHDRTINSTIKDTDVSGLLSKDDRETLGINQGEPMQLWALAALVTDYVANHKRAVREPVAA